MVARPSSREEIYNERNRYNYWLNISHHDVQAAYRRYCARIGNPPHYPLSDKERREFEIEFIQQNGIGADMPEWVRYQLYDEARSGTAPDIREMIRRL